jgi:hypothetical protein
LPAAAKGWSCYSPRQVLFLLEFDLLKASAAASEEPMAGGEPGFRRACMNALARLIQHSVSWRSRAVVRSSRDLFQAVRGAYASRRVDKLPIDPRISYPCYKSLDEYVDVERLKSLDAYLRERIVKHLKGGTSAEFYTGVFKRYAFSPAKPGSREIPLTVSKRPFEYHDLNKSQFWEPSKHASEFAELMDFIATLPFKTTARMLIICDPQGRAVTAHRDHANPNAKHEFVWFRSNLDKPFYMQDSRSRRKVYVDSYSAWFDTVNQYHGAESGNTLTFSLRVDGVFSDEFRQPIPIPVCNPASTAALWASLSR